MIMKGDKDNKEKDILASIFNLSQLHWTMNKQIQPKIVINIVYSYTLKYSVNNIPIMENKNRPYIMPLRKHQ